MNIDLLISGGTVISMDSHRRVIEDGAVAVYKGKIVEVGTSSELTEKYTPNRMIEATHKVIMPGLIDSHAHAGHGLVKTMGGGDSQAWYHAVQQIYTQGSDEAFWYAEAKLATLERLKSGITTGLSYFGGGDNVMRSDDPRYARQHCKAVAEVGIRNFLALGVCRPPFPVTFSHWDDDIKQDHTITFEDQIATIETIIQEKHGTANGKQHICLVFPTPNADDMQSTGKALDDLKARSKTVRDLTRKYNILFTMDGHRGGTIQYTHDVLELTGSDAIFSHSIDLTEAEIQICKDTDTRIAHNPSAIFSIYGRCPVPELLDAGVTVMLGSDGTAPDRGYDMFRHMWQCMHYHRRHFQDSSILPPGKMLEMVTIDAAHGLGLGDEIGSLEAGKRADIILIDLYKPHTYPFNMPVYRTVCFANAADVDTVIVDGEILMEHRQVMSVDEPEVLDLAQRETETMLHRTGLHHLLDLSDDFWGQSVNQ